jgi:hypothetical protein
VLPYVILGVTLVAIIVGGVVVGRLLWRRQVRRYIVSLLGRREAIEAAMRTLEGVVQRLSAASDDEMIAFAIDSDSPERQATAETADQMRIQSDELRDVALPKALWVVADRLCDASKALTDQSAGVGEQTGTAVLDALGSVDLTSVKRLLSEATEELERVSAEYGLGDLSVYGGGLYI